MNLEFSFSVFHTIFSLFYEIDVFRRSCGDWLSSDGFESHTANTKVKFQAHRLLGTTKNLVNFKTESLDGRSHHSSSGGSSGGATAGSGSGFFSAAASGSLSLDSRLLPSWGMRGPMQAQTLLEMLWTKEHVASMQSPSTRGGSPSTGVTWSATGSPRDTRSEKGAAVRSTTRPLTCDNELAITTIRATTLVTPMAKCTASIARKAQDQAQEKKDQFWVSRSTRLTTDSEATLWLIGQRRYGVVGRQSQRPDAPWDTAQQCTDVLATHQRLLVTIQVDLRRGIVKDQYYLPHRPDGSAYIDHGLRFDVCHQEGSVQDDHQLAYCRHYEVEDAKGHRGQYIEHRVVKGGRHEFRNLFIFNVKR